ncbi:hypothetical protein MuYL_1621 [Mucilaginibacter xinganensis]|uniref:SnoaL-like domain-containing protein n=1 Tax=Mucilaginibacter xinganensis TaxID=1234841 RepID=A0A223NUE5_9SPHI|nr:hypothetical protein MuYL_1621 [Mucilaginibacter xinganensis]
MITGNAALIDFCNRTAKYFSGVNTKFTMENVIADGDCEAINGTAEFYMEKENRTNFISSCDVYNLKMEN